MKLPLRAALFTALYAGIQSALAVPFAVGVPSIGPNGHSYQVYRDDGVPWLDAHAFATGLGGGWHLATVSDVTENDFIESLRLASSLGEVWLGGYQDPAGETTPGAGWTWVNGEGPFSYTNWLGGEPNDAYGPGTEQHLAIGLVGDSGWNDEGALGLIHGFVVEKNGSGKVPDGGSLVAPFLAVIGGLALRRRR